MRPTAAARRGRGSPPGSLSRERGARSRPGRPIGPRTASPSRAPVSRHRSRAQSVAGVPAAPKRERWMMSPERGKGGGILVGENLGEVGFDVGGTGERGIIAQQAQMGCRWWRGPRGPRRAHSDSPGARRWESGTCRSRGWGCAGRVPPPGERRRPARADRRRYRATTPDSSARSVKPSVSFKKSRTKRRVASDEGAPSLANASKCAWPTREGEGNLLPDG